MRVCVSVIFHRLLRPITGLLDIRWQKHHKDLSEILSILRGVGSTIYLRATRVFLCFTFQRLPDTITGLASIQCEILSFLITLCPGLKAVAKICYIGDFC